MLFCYVCVKYYLSMITAVIGSRSFSGYKFVFRELEKYSISCIVSGGAKGADSLAIHYAYSHNISTQVYLPDYSKYGKSAPFIRNKLIIESSDFCIAFWDGISRGTKYTLDIAKKMEVPTMIYTL